MCLYILFDTRQQEPRSYHLWSKDKSAHMPWSTGPKPRCTNKELRLWYISASPCLGNKTLSFHRFTIYNHITEQISSNPYFSSDLRCLASAQSPGTCSFARHLAGKMVIPKAHLLITIRNSKLLMSRWGQLLRLKSNLCQRSHRGDLHHRSSCLVRLKLKEFRCVFPQWGLYLRQGMYNYPTYSKTLFCKHFLSWFIFFLQVVPGNGCYSSLWLSDVPSDNLYHVVMNIPPLPKGNASKFMVDSP